MNTKITLSIDERIAEQAKSFAKRSNKSISKIIEDYLFSISSENYQDNSIVRKVAPITSELLGMIKCDNKNFDYKKTLEDEISEKYQ